MTLSTTFTCGNILYYVYACKNGKYIFFLGNCSSHGNSLGHPKAQHRRPRLELNFHIPKNPENPSRTILGHGIYIEKTLVKIDDRFHLKVLSFSFLTPLCPLTWEVQFYVFFFLGVKFLICWPWHTTSIYNIGSSYCANSQNFGVFILIDIFNWKLWMDTLYM